MAAITVTLLDPIVVDGSTRRRTLKVTANINNNDTYDASKEFTQVLDASFFPDASGVTYGIAYSGNGDTTLTFKMGAPAKGRLVIRGL